MRRTLARMEKKEAATECYRRALALKPECGEVWAELMLPEEQYTGDVKRS